MVFFILLGTILIPFQARANFLSSILGTDVSASVDNTSPTQFDKSLQSTDLLQANVSSAPIIQDKKNKENKNNPTNGEIKEDVSVNILSNNALVPTAGPTTGIDNTFNGDSFTDQISVYVIRKGDSISKIAEMFDVSVNTILWANDMKKGDKLVEGVTLFILPVSGVKHTVSKGQTLKTIAKFYKANVSDIAQFNGLAEDAKLAVGDELLIPDGELNDEGGKPAKNLNGSVDRDKKYYEKNFLPTIADYFIDPLPTGHKTQGLHGPGHRGIDIGAPTGTPIYASAKGIVSIARIGWSGGYGNMLILNHPNGTKTLYAHMYKLATHTGDEVNQGEIIGYVGSTGRSTGPHLHFEVFNAKNPGANWSWKD